MKLAIMMLLAGTAAGHSGMVKVVNSCPFDVDYMINNNIENISQGQTKMVNMNFPNARFYVGPTGTLKKDLDQYKFFGWWEPNMQDGKLNMAMSNIEMAGIPSTCHNCHDTRGDMGCAGDQFTGWRHYQDQIRQYCPTKPGSEALKIGPVYVCRRPGLYGHAQGDSDAPNWSLTHWDLDATKTAVKLTSWKHEPRTAPSWTQNKDQTIEALDDIARCQGKLGDSGSFGHKDCASLNLGFVDPDPKNPAFNSWYPNYNPEQREKNWPFNPYAAFVAHICGKGTNYAFPSDDSATFVMSEKPDAYLELCPPAKSLAGSNSSSTPALGSTSSSTQAQIGSNSSASSNATTLESRLTPAGSFRG